MLKSLKVKSMEDLISKTVPSILRTGDYDIGKPLSEDEALASLRKLASKNKVYRSYIGQGYYNTSLPKPILRNLLENPAWYTSYTPYQAEVSQGRLESLMNFQVMVGDLTGLPIAGASLLDEATAAGEALALCAAADKRKGPKSFLVHQDVFRQTVSVLKSRAEPKHVNVTLVDVSDPALFTDIAAGKYGNVSGILVQYPCASGTVRTDMADLVKKTHDAGALFVCATDLLALTLLTPPGEFGADIALGSAQRFGVPQGYGGPHAAFFATTNQFVRSLPGRIIGLSKDANGSSAFRMALQTREQHIRREKATSNICTAQALLANIAAMYAVYHGAEGLKEIALNAHYLAHGLQNALREHGLKVNSTFFDTISVNYDHNPAEAESVIGRALAKKINLGRIGNNVIVAFDELATVSDLRTIIKCFGSSATRVNPKKTVLEGLPLRSSSYLQDPIFNTYRCETDITRYLHRLADKDVSLTRSMITLGSCTMKLNATSEMIPVTWPEFSQIHPFTPANQVEGYRSMIHHLEEMLAVLTGFSAVSLQPNAGSQGELAGLLTIRAYLAHRDGNRSDNPRNVCLIPRSAHGTNPATASMAGMEIVVVACNEAGEVDMADFHEKVKTYSDRLAALMITYPSTHGVFEETIKEICEAVHANGGQVYMDGANMNAQCGLTSPGAIGADVCHLNLHKTFCIPHGGGGPGVGPICVAAHLAPFLPSYDASIVPGIGGTHGINAVSAAPFGSASILPIPYMYLRMMGTRGIRRATEVAILNANYMAKRLSPFFPVLYKGTQGFVAHEFIIDCRHFEEVSGVTTEDIAKRLIDFGFHAPTMSFPVAGTLMIEPTESESKQELDRFCDALIQIRKEIENVEKGVWPRDNNPLKHAPHTAAVVSSDTWDHPYSRHEAAYPLPWVALNKYWPPVGRVDNVYGDKNLNLHCACDPIESYITTSSSSQ